MRETDLPATPLGRKDLDFRTVLCRCLSCRSGRRAVTRDFGIQPLLFQTQCPEAYGLGVVSGAGGG